MVCINNGLRMFQHHGACAPGYEFSATQRTCLPVSLANCSVPVSTTLSSTPSTTVMTTDIRTSTTTTTPIKTTTMGLADMSNLCTAPGQITDPTSCRHYIVCSWATQTTLKATRISCPTGLFFDTGLQQCVFTTNCGTRSL
jgi:hypothetical protein